MEAEKPWLVTAEQSNDLGLWADPETAFEKYLQDALKRLTLAVQGREPATPPTPDTALREAAIALRDNGMTAVTAKGEEVIGVYPRDYHALLLALAQRTDLTRQGKTETEGDSAVVVCHNCGYRNYKRCAQREEQ